MSARRNPRIDFLLPAIRKQRDLTLKDVQSLTGVPVSTLSDLETGKNAMPSDDTLVALCDGLGVQTSDIISVNPVK